MLEKEPPDPENPLLHMDNVILTPHVASASARMAPESRRRVGQEIALVLTGRWPKSLREPVRAGQDGPSPLAAVLHGARAGVIAQSTWGMFSGESACAAWD